MIVRTISGKITPCSAVTLAVALAASGILAAGPQGVKAAQADSLQDTRITVARVRYGGGGDWYSDPSSLPNLLYEFEIRTGIPTAGDEQVIELTDPDIFRYPFLYITGHGDIRLEETELAALREHLLSGGFLYADDNYGMDSSFRKMVKELFPEKELAPVPFSHPIYRCFYQLEGPPKIHQHDGKPPQGLGIFHNRKLAIFYTYQSDIGDGLEDPDVHGNPPEKRELAMRMAVNILFYSLTY
jgi:hypothetical protein